MNLYGVDGIRHQAVAFGATPEEAMAQALANGEVDDRQLAQFKADPLNHGKVMNRGVWRYTRHPNYFGDAAQWWGYGSSRSRRVDDFQPHHHDDAARARVGYGVARKDDGDKTGYKEYTQTTSAFVPWFPRKRA